MVFYRSKKEFHDIERVIEEINPMNHGSSVCLIMSQSLPTLKEKGPSMLNSNNMKW